MQDKSLLGSMNPELGAAPQPGPAPTAAPQPGQGGSSMGPNAAIKKIQEGISDFIHGQAREQILQTFEQDSSPKAAAAILYKPARQGIEQAEAKGVEVDEEFVFAVATDGIDMLAEILQAMGKLGKDDKALNEFRQSTLMEVMMLHAEQVGDDPEAQDIAKQKLAGYAEDGSLENAINYVEGQAGKNGIDVNQMRADGQQMVAPKQNPIAAGVSEGLNNG